MRQMGNVRTFSCVWMNIYDQTLFTSGDLKFSIDVYLSLYVTQIASSNQDFIVLI